MQARGRMGSLLWSRDSPRSLKETAEGRDPKSPGTAPTAWRWTHIPITLKEKQAREVQRTASPGTPMLVCHEVHTLGKRRSRRWRKSGALLGVQGKPKPFRAASSTVTVASQKVQGPPSRGTTSLLLGVGLGAASEPEPTTHRKGDLTAAASGLGRLSIPSG